MKLYYSPGACSQAPHILLHEIGLDHDVARVDLKAKKLADGGDYLKINPKGSVPALELDSGEVLTENAVILQYLGDRTNWPEVFPPLGDFRRYRVLEMLNYITTELHKRFGLLFNPRTLDETKALVIEELGRKLDFVEQRLGDGPFLFGDTITLPDPYLFVITGWAEKMLGGLNRWPNLAAFRRRMLERSSVRNVLRLEGLLEEEAAG
ncbi:MAG TPA: glutathione transferase GstA [Sphingomicrobium sp.]|nr:glutathione transferase GstA [Sphingomicrobium sp.]